MTDKQFQKKALSVIKKNPGLTRMEWFEATCKLNNENALTWHHFKFQVALQLILGGHVKADGDKFFHILHN